MRPVPLVQHPDRTLLWLSLLFHLFAIEGKLSLWFQFNSGEQRQGWLPCPSLSQMDPVFRFQSPFPSILGCLGLQNQLRKIRMSFVPVGEPLGREAGSQRESICSGDVDARV